MESQPNPTGSAPSKIALYGKCNSVMAFVPIEKTFAQSLLPNGLELADQSLTDPDHHVALLHFNRTHLNFAWLPPVAQLNYHEFIFLLPYVKRSDPQSADPTVYSFVPVLYLDSFLAIWGGRWMWEFNKLPAHFEVTDTRTHIASPLLRTPMLHAVSEKAGPVTPNQSLPNFNAITPMLKMPFIMNGLLGLVTATYRFHYEGLSIQPTRVEATNVSSPYLPQRSFSVPPISEATFGAFQMDYKWDLSFIRFLR